MPWPRQACVSRTYLPEVVPPASVSAKWGACGGQGGRAGRRGFWATPRALVTGHPISTSPQPPTGEFQVKSHSQGCLGEKRKEQIQPITCWVGMALKSVVANQRAGGDSRGGGPPAQPPTCTAVKAVGGRGPNALIYVSPRERPIPTTVPQVLGQPRSPHRL